MDAAFATLHRLAADGDEDTRVAIMRETQVLLRAAERPMDILERIAFRPIEPVMARLGGDMGLFKALEQSTMPLANASLAQRIGADELLVARVMRCLAAFGMVHQVQPGKYRSNRISSFLAEDDIQAFLRFLYVDAPRPLTAIAMAKENANHGDSNATGQSAWDCLPGFLEKTGYKNPVNPRACPFTLAHNVNGTAFDYFNAPGNEQLLRDTGRAMAIWRIGFPDWLDVYPLAEEAEGLTAEDVLFVDVGGSKGHQCKMLRDRHPSIIGRIILQDLTEVVAVAPALSTVEKMAHDFFTPQPVRGARFYYLRTVLHDWDDQHCSTILGHLKDAMSDRSRILIDEMQLSDLDPHYYGAQEDMHMLTMNAGQERSKSQWQALLAGCGLRIERQYTYTQPRSDTVMVVARL